jgi:hypothetical protein
MQVKRTAPSVDVGFEPFDIRAQGENKSASNAYAAGTEFANKGITGNSTKQTVRSLTVR